MNRESEVERNRQPAHLWEMRGSAVVHTFLAAAATFGCPIGSDARADTPDGMQQLRHVVRDSAGVRIVENRRPRIDSRLGWTVGVEPVVTIGARDASDAFQLYRVRDATRLGADRIAVANGSSNELLVFDADGNYLGAWGGQGEGPGEFMSLALVRPWGPDSLIAADAQNGRISVFDLDGKHGRTKSLRGDPSSFSRTLMATAGQEAESGISTLDTHVAVGVLPDGTLLTRDTGGFGAQGLWRNDYAYAMMSSDGFSRLSLGEFPGPEHYSESYVEGDLVHVMPLRHPFGRTTLTAVWGDLAVTGRNETYEIRAYLSDGSLSRIVRRDHEVRSPSKAEQDAAFGDRFAGLADDDRQARMKVAVNAPVVASFPAYSSLRGDALDHLWVAEFKLPDAKYDGTLWTVFDPEGRALGSVETPSGLTIYEIGADYILGKTTDDLNVEYIQLWGLTRSN